MYEENCILRRYSMFVCLLEISSGVLIKYHIFYPNCFKFGIADNGGLIDFVGFTNDAHNSNLLACDSINFKIRGCESTLYVHYTKFGSTHTLRL